LEKVRRETPTASVMSAIVTAAKPRSMASFIADSARARLVASFFRSRRLDGSGLSTAALCSVLTLTRTMLDTTCSMRNLSHQAPSIHGEVSSDRVPGTYSDELRRIPTS